MKLLFRPDLISRVSLRKATSRLAICAALLMPGIAQAACGGINLLDTIRAEQPGAYAEIEANANRIPNAVGKFWRIEKPGVEPSHLFGTFHDTEAHELVGDVVWETLAESDGAWFELSQAEQERMETAITANPLEMIFDVDAPPLSSLLDREALGMLEDALGDRGVPLQAAEQMRPWMLVAMLGFPACQFFALQSGEKPLDNKLARFALDRGVSNHGLETFEEALGALNSIAGDDLASMVVDLGSIRDVEEDQRRTRLDLYDDGQIQFLQEYGIWDAEQRGLENARERTEDFMKRLLDDRNRAWMGEILDAVTQGDAFIAVGALHLPGEVGLIELLRREGWTVTRLDG